MTLGFVLLESEACLLKPRRKITDDSSASIELNRHDEILI